MTTVSKKEARHFIAVTPRWVKVFLVPFINIIIAFIVSGIFLLSIGENPIDALGIMLQGAFGSSEGLGYTLYYTTNLIFTGLAVAVAFHCGLFNIGGEGQAYIGGLGVGLLALAFDGISWPWMMLISIIGSAVFGALWAFIPAYLQAKRGSHIVITTIMFNFIAASLMVYILVNLLIEPGQMSPETRSFDSVSMLPFVHNMLGAIGIHIDRSPLNISFIWALICCYLVWVLIWRSRWGYALRAVGKSHSASTYAGISNAQYIIIAMLISGALAGFVGVNEIIGVQHRLLLNFQAGFGFTGIAVALMGRNHPIGIFFTAILFGFLYQGGAELAFETQTITPEVVVLVQGLIVLFTGALENLFKPKIEAIFTRKVPTVILNAD